MALVRRERAPLMWPGDMFRAASTPTGRSRDGSFERDIALPPGVDPAGIEASYTDGILTVRIPLPAEKEKPAG